MNSNKNLIRKITKPSLKNREIEDKILSAAKKFYSYQRDIIKLQFAKLLPQPE